MGFESEFADLMHDEVTIQPYLGRDGYGRATFGAARVYRARVVGRLRRITAMSGQEAVSTATTVLLNSTGVNPESRITLPEGFEPRTPPILAILRDKDDRGRITETIFTSLVLVLLL
jgi:hypothetical protein